MEHSRDKEFFERLISVNRVGKVQKGGRRFSFSVMVVVGDRQGKVGYGMGKANDTTDAIRKAVDRAKRGMISIPLKNGTILHPIMYKFKASKIMLKPAAPGTGILAGGHIRSVMEAVGVHDILTKRMGSGNSINIVKGVFEALQSMLDGRITAKSRGKTLKDMWG